MAIDDTKVIKSAFVAKPGEAVELNVPEIKWVSAGVVAVVEPTLTPKTYNKAGVEARKAVLLAELANADIILAAIAEGDALEVAKVTPVE